MQDKLRWETITDIRILFPFLVYTKTNVWVIINLYLSRYWNEMEADMKKRITEYLRHMDELLQQMSNDEIKQNMNLSDILDNHMRQIEFFMHERLVHLIVMVLFAIGTFMTVFTYLLTDNIGLLMLALLLIVLLAPYIKHYYLLENGVQKMYVQYDRLIKYMGKSV